MANFVEQQYAITLVGKPGSALEEQLITSVLQRANLVAGKVRWLSQTGDLHAIEATVTLLPDQTVAGDLEEALSQVRDGNQIDGAITPLTDRRKRLLVCDMDSTIIGQECLDELADFAELKTEIAAITERAMRGELDFEAALETRVAMLEGLSVDALQQCYETRISLNPGARTLVRTMKANGARCLLVSGGFRFFTSRVAAAAGFDADHANDFILSGDELTGAVVHPILGREAKRATLTDTATALGIDPSLTMAIGDGANDLAMIEAAGLGIAYRAKPVVATRADCAINHTDLTAALYFQGYTQAEFVS